MDTEKILKEGMDKFQRLFNYDARVGLNETTFLSNGVEEDENDPNADPNAAAGDASGADMGGGAPMDPNAASGADMGTGAPMDPNAAPGADAPMDPNAAPDAGTGDEEAAAPPQGFNPQPAAGGDISAADFDAAGGDMQQPGDEVLDVTELTDKQEDIEKEVSEIGGKFDKVMKALGAFEELVRANNEKIEDLKAEYERRNPTQVEKLSMQTAKSYPFNVTPEEFWKEKEATSNYSTEDDDNGKEQGQYQITANDVAGATDWKAISDSLDDDDFMYNQTLAKVMGL